MIIADKVINEVAKAKNKLTNIENRNRQAVKILACKRAVSFSSSPLPTSNLNSNFKYPSSSTNSGNTYRSTSIMSSSTRLNKKYPAYEQLSRNFLCHIYKISLSRKWSHQMFQRGITFAYLHLQKKEKDNGNNVKNFTVPFKKRKGNTNTTTVLTSAKTLGLKP